MTDAHVRFTEGWDLVIARHASANRILAGTVLDPTSRFAGTGCRLIVPFMGTKWVRADSDEPFLVHIAACAATVVPRRLFAELGGYDAGMRMYGGAEPEFSVRAWLAGAEIVGLPGLHVAHRFKPVEERDQFVGEHRHLMIHNCLRFGMLYLDPPAVLQMLRHFTMEFPNRVAAAFRLLHDSDVWERREFLKRTLPRDFHWFIRRFDLKDQVGGEILTVPRQPAVPSRA